MIFVIGMGLLSSCNTTKFLQEDQALLKGVEVKLESKDKVANANDLKKELIQFYKQEPNGKFFFVPREWYYFRNQEKGDTTWVKNWTKRMLAEEPAIIDTIHVMEASEDMEMYLRNKKGFYKAEVNKEIEIKDQIAHVKFIVDPKKRYTINSLQYLTLDPKLKPIIDSLAQYQLIEAGDPIDALKFDLEKQRIVSELQNHGYANFNLNFIDIKGDSTDLENSIDIFFEILPPNINESHQKFQIGEIKVFTDYHQFQIADSLVSETRFGKEFFRESDKYIVKPGIINRKLFLKPFSTYRTEDYAKTSRKLFSLGTYRFVKIKPTVNPRADSIIDYSIYLTPQRNKWIFDFGTDLFFSNISRVDRNLVGFAIGTGLENRNAFGGSERFKFSFETGVEFVAGTPIETNTFSLGVNNSLDFPKLNRTLNTLKFFDNIGIISDRAWASMRDEGKTTISAGYNFLDILNNYKISSFNTSYGYDFKFGKKYRLVYNQVGLNLTNYTTRPAFDTILQNNPLLERSFNNSFFSGLFFRDVAFYFQSDNGPNRTNYAFISNLEISGLEVYLANKAYNSLANRTDTWTFNNSTGFEKFIKFDMDGRWYRRIYKDSQLAARLKTGIVLPYGDKDAVVSYIKQLLVGGPNSIRGWRPMELGPGSYNHDSSKDPSFFQRGNLSLEFSLEYRFDLFWLVEGALFLDGGNIWTLKNDPIRPGAQISSDFYNQIALGYGYGLRWDFTYFIIRFDFGFKLRTPYVDPERNTKWVPLKGQGIFGNLNVAVNYPF